MADKKLKHTGEEIDDAIDNVNSMMAEVFPLTVSYASQNSGVREVGTSVTPTVSLNIIRQGKDVSSSATINNPVGTTVGSDNKSWTANEAISSGSVTYNTSVEQGGQTKSLSALTWAFTYYRYRGAISGVPTDFADAIKALATKELSTSAQLGSTALDANKYYLFAVKGAGISFVVKHAQTGGTIEGCTTGEATISQENDSTKTNTYSYVLVPASSASWNFTIN